MVGARCVRQRRRQRSLLARKGFARIILPAADVAQSAAGGCCSGSAAGVAGADRCCGCTCGAVGPASAWCTAAGRSRGWFCSPRMLRRPRPAVGAAGAPPGSRGKGNLSGACSRDLSWLMPSVRPCAWDLQPSSSLFGRMVGPLQMLRRRKRCVIVRLEGLPVVAADTCGRPID
jgi:hypothetical protein